MSIHIFSNMKKVSCDFRLLKKSPSCSFTGGNTVYIEHIVCNRLIMNTPTFTFIFMHPLFTMKNQIRLAILFAPPIHLQRPPLHTSPSHLFAFAKHYLINESYYSVVFYSDLLNEISQSFPPVFGNDHNVSLCSSFPLTPSIL